MRPAVCHVIALTLGLAAALAAPLAAETRQHGNLVFDIPKGWTVGSTRDDGTLILRSDLPDDLCEYCRIYITPGEQTAGRADAWVAGQARRFIDKDDTPEIKTIVAPEIANLQGRPAAMLGQTVDDDLQILFAIQLSGRMELVGFDAPADDEAELAKGVEVFQRDVFPMLEGALFVSEGAEPVMPPPQPGDLDGLWWGTSTRWSMGLDGLMAMQLDHHWLTFHPDGTFYDGTPPNGLQPIDQAGRLAAGDMKWGSYRQDGSRLILTYASGETAEFQGTGDSFIQDDLTLSPVPPLDDGTRIDGMVSTFFYSGFTPGSGVSGGVSSATETHFHPDGTWDFGSSGGASASFDGGGGFATSNENQAQGRYEVRDGLAIRMDENGAVVGSDWIFKSGSDIWIGSEMLEPG